MNPEETLAVVVRNLANQFYRFMKAKKAEFAKVVGEAASITDAQGRIIEHLYLNMAKETVYQKDLEKQFNIRRSTATIMLQRMEKAGLIRREACAEDGRMKALVLTEKAKSFRPMAHEAIREAEEQARRGLTKQEVETFFRVIKKIAANIS